ncbi:MAG TPA: hypothetical protein PKN80_07535 [bacterium]|uniref:Uncharacterized protein n=1 Tax=candidate division TA06 bacterium ADurb.Bin417 TaxID=1852828 RepID=A0A1V5MIF5_UNCT6|nr:MAG: hypothetical protein BWY73_00520 [candidate division TA06 bacterium ADurb.Bin417]HNQ35897.1 hypothetical protein [bacterium]HNS48073.1 hypothetical protein [bacterium]
MIFVCSEKNDLWLTLQNSSAGGHRRCGDLETARREAAAGSAILMLADGYPVPGPAVSRAFLEGAQAKSLRLYLEYPGALPGLEMGEARQAEWERIVVTSDFFAPALEKGSLLALHGCWFLPVEPRAAHLAAARVAGYRRAVYGIPAAAFPILLQPEHYPGLLVATSQLSNFITGRYGPQESWRKVWTAILAWLEPGESPPRLNWRMTVRPSFDETDELPPEAESRARERLTAWFRNQAIYNVAFSRGGFKGVIEGFEAGIDYTGRQRLKTWARADCLAETGMLFACDWSLKHQPDSRRLAGRLMDYLWLSPDFIQADPTSPVYGLCNWYEKGPVFYGDDNARVLIASLCASGLLEETRWDERILRCLLANLRTSGSLGFRRKRFDYPATFQQVDGWRHLNAEPTLNLQPHFQAYLWAAFLWAYALTGYRGFLDRTANALRLTMEAYPDRWQWTNGLTQEMARMLLPLAWLLRIESRPEYRDWLERILAGLQVDMQPGGAIRERLGALDKGQYPPPASNEKYGTTEAPLIQENGDPACDLLYSLGYAFIGLHEAFCSTADPRLKEAGDRLAAFLCRVQIASESHPYLDGAWMRGFDYRLWEYWGSSADADWGAWSVETGWTNTWIGTTMALRKQGLSLLDTAKADRLREKFPGLRAEMLAESALSGV